MSAYRQELLEAEFGASLRFYEELGSTNDEALRLAKEGCQSGTLVLAEKQTAGRGRRGTEWFSGEEESLAFSFVLRPGLSRALWSRLSLVAGLAVTRVLERRQIVATIKWPNDVLVSGKKICGILIEAEGDVVVFGLGLNVGQANFPSDIAASATSMREVAGEDYEREEILTELVKELAYLVERADTEFSELLVMIRERCGLTGHHLSFMNGKTSTEGFCEGIGEGGELLVSFDGSTHRIIAAELIRVID